MKNLLTLCVLLFGTIGVHAQLKVYPTGHVGISGTLPTASPAYPVQFFGGTAVITLSSNKPLLLTSATLDPRIQTTTGGKIVFYNTANSGWIDIEVKSVLTMSDAKFKTNVTSIADRGALTTVKQLKGVEFNLADEPNGKKHSGFIAQDLEKVLPHLVATDDSVGNKSIDYQAIIPYLVEAIKEQQTQIDQLTQKLSSSSDTDANSTEKRLAKEEAIRDDKRLIHLANSQE